jgi:predicted RNA-binding Zn-ribbon protein involved in translation (DUF1610 family)
VRCIACGEKMLLLNVVPDRTMIVPGYEHQTLQCPGCGETEHRLVFKSERSPLASAEPSSSQADERVTARAMEQLRRPVCFACGKRMTLVAATPDDKMMVPGYEHQTLRCSTCGASESRLIFNPGRPLPISVIAPAEDTE